MHELITVEAAVSAAGRSDEAIFDLNHHGTGSGGTGHSANSLHYPGDAVDLGTLDGHLLTGRDAYSMKIIKE